MIHSKPHKGRWIRLSVSLSLSLTVRDFFFQWLLIRLDPPLLFTLRASASALSVRPSARPSFLPALHPHIETNK